ncbi:MAG: YgfZ/GcvT domain-containing protein [Fimbriimonadaceae bacterium]
MSDDLATPIALTDRVQSDYSLLAGQAALCPFPAVQALQVFGADAKGWLQGQVTQDLRTLGPGRSKHSCFCQPTGQLIAILDIWALDDSLVVATDVAAFVPTLERLQKSIIMEDVQLEPMADDWAHFLVQGASATEQLEEIIELPSMDAGKAPDALVLRSDRTGFGGWEIWTKGDSNLATQIQSSFPEIGEQAIRISRLEAGIPTFGIDTNQKTLPPELGEAFDSSHISYKKGCYTGQEVLMRMHSRGHTNRTWMGFFSPQPVPRGSTLSHHSRPDAGTVTQSVESPVFGHIGAAMVRNEFAREGDILLANCDEGTIECEMKVLPF